MVSAARSVGVAQRSRSPEIVDSAEFGLPALQSRGLNTRSRSAQGRRDGEIVTLDGLNGIVGNHPIVEFAHTHPKSSSANYAYFSGDEAGDIWTDCLKIPFSMRYAEGVALYDPMKLKVRRHSVTSEIIAYPGRTLFRMNKRKREK